MLAQFLKCEGLYHPCCFGSISVPDLPAHTSVVISMICPVKASYWRSMSHHPKVVEEDIDLIVETEDEGEDDDDADDDEDVEIAENGRWRRGLADGSARFDEYYKAQKITSEVEWNLAYQSLLKPLPLCLRFDPTSEVCRNELVRASEGYLKEVEWAKGCYAVEDWGEFIQDRKRGDLSFIIRDSSCQTLYNMKHNPSLMSIRQGRG